VSQWVGIESEADGGQVARRAPQVAAAGRPAPRLRRAERLILGSIDGAAHVLQRRARDVLVGSAVFMVPMVGVGVLLAVLAFDRFDTFDSVLGDRGYIGAESGFAFLAIALQSFTAHLIGAYTAVFLVRYQMGGSPGIGECVRPVLRRLPLLAVTWVITTAVGAAVRAVAGPARTTPPSSRWSGSLPPTAATLSTCVLLVTPVMMGEGLGSPPSPAQRLARMRFGAAFGFVVACSVLAVLLFSFIAFLPQLAEATGLVTFGSYMWLVQGVTTQLALLVVIPFTAIATTQLYLQIRVHAEGLDLVVAADRAFGRRP
jgi:hypothetical protein